MFERKPAPAAGQSVLWKGRPGQGLRFRNADLLLVPISIGVAYISALPLAAIVRVYKVAPNEGLLVVITLFATLHALFMFYLVLGRFGLDAFRRSRISYAVTDREIAIVAEPPYERSTHIELRKLPELKIDRLVFGRGGTLWFGPQPLLGVDRDTGAMGGMPSVPCFEFLDDPDAVLATVTSARDALFAAAPSPEP
jgi:hypothetical protein